MREVLYRPDWQAVRVSLLKEYHPSGGWTTEVGVRSNLTAINEYAYLDEEGMAAEAKAMGYSVAVEQSVRLYRTINCLNAVRMGYSGQGIAGETLDTLTRCRRDEMQLTMSYNYMADLHTAERKWNEQVIWDELVEQFLSNRSAFNNTYENLCARQDTATKKPQGVEKRQELVGYLNLMRRVRETT